MPAAVIANAEEWLDAHNKFHRDAEDRDIARSLVYEQARRAARSGAASSIYTIQ